MKNGKPKTYPIPQYKGEPGKIPCPHCNRPLADEKQLESHIKRFIVNIVLFGRVFLQRHIWIINYYEKKFVKKSHKSKQTVFVVFKTKDE